MANKVTIWIKPQGGVDTYRYDVSEFDFVRWQDRAGGFYWGRVVRLHHGEPKVKVQSHAAPTAESIQRDRRHRWIGLERIVEVRDRLGAEMAPVVKEAA